MGIKMNMFAGNQMTAANDGMIYDKMIASSGILKGCEMTFMGANQIHIAKGYIIIKGRLCTILEETMQVEMANTDVEMPGRLYVHADLADAISPVKIVSVVAAVLPSLIQDEDFNFDNGIYELELGTYTAGRVAIRDFKSTCEMVDDMGGTRKEIDKINGNITVLSQKITSFENTKSEIAASGLGAALGLAASNTWAQIVAKIKSIANRGVLNWSGSNTTFAVPAGYYPGGTLDSRPSYNSGYNAGVTAADNRANVNSANYKAGYNAGAAANALRSKKLYWELNAKSYETCGSFTAEKTGTHVFMFHTYTQDVPNRFQARALCNNTTISSIEGARNKTGWYFSVSLTVGNVVTFQMCNTYHPYNSALDGVVCY